MFGWLLGRPPEDGTILVQHNRGPTRANASDRRTRAWWALSNAGTRAPPIQQLAYRVALLAGRRIEQG